jgi:hypothetical protein
MGWPSKLFEGSLLEDVLGGIVVGGAIGEILDNRRDRQETLRLLRLKIAQDRYFHTLDQADRERV